MESAGKFYYKLYVVSDRPHHEGVEYWIRSTAVDIADCLEDWMPEYVAFGIVLFQLDVPDGVDLSDEFGIYSECTKKELAKAKKLAPVIDKKYKTTSNIFDLNDDNIYECSSCRIITIKTKCVKCGNQTTDIEK